MPDPTTDEMAELVKEQSKRIVEELGQELESILFIKTPKGIAIADVRLDEKMKLVWKEAISMVLRQLEATGYVWVCEAWQTNSMRPIDENIRVSDLPPDDKQEIAMIHVCENGKSFKALFASINNTPQGRKLGEFKTIVESTGGKSEMEGRMIITSW